MLQFCFTRVIFCPGKKIFLTGNKAEDNSSFQKLSALFTVSHIHSTRPWPRTAQGLSAATQKILRISIFPGDVTSDLLEGNRMSKASWTQLKDKSLADHILKDDSLVGLALVSKKCWWMCLWVGSKELNCWWIPAEGTDIRKEAQHSLLLTKQPISLWQRKNRHTWFELEPWWAFKAYPGNWFFLRNLMFNLLHHITKTILAGASTCKPNLITKLVMRIQPIGYTCRTTFHQWYLSLLWSKRYISSHRQKVIQIYPQKWTWICREH